MKDKAYIYSKEDEETDLRGWAGIAELKRDAEHDTKDKVNFSFFSYSFFISYQIQNI